MSEYWDHFYLKGEAPKQPSDFCRFFMEQKIEGESCVDLGCGNGRDTLTLGKRYLTVGIDSASQNDDTLLDFSQDGWATYIRSDFGSCLDLIAEADIVYSRFFLHSISDIEIETILKATKGYFAAETRIIGDEPKLYPYHERNLIDCQALIRMAMDMGFDLTYYREGRGMAEYRDEDPLVARIIMKKKS